MATTLLGRLPTWIVKHPTASFSQLTTPFQLQMTLFCWCVWKHRFRASETLVAFADLTSDIVVGWIKEKLTAEKVTEVETALQAQLDEQRAPSKAAGLPWAAAE